MFNSRRIVFCLSCSLSQSTIILMISMISGNHLDISGHAFLVILTAFAIWITTVIWDLVV